jgi:methanogenic corrinoid protein MtbC1
MSDTLERIALCTERGKMNKDAPYPPDMRGEDVVDELVALALESGIDPNDVLTQGLMVGMERVGKKFSNNEVFVPDLLMAAKAMGIGMDYLKPHFESGAAQRRGKVIIGTVQGDLHDIGKNLVRMMMEGGGWEVIDLGVDVSADKFVEALDANPGSMVGLSALLTTTMVNMEKTVSAIKEKAPGTVVLVGGAPLTQEFCDKIGADSYSPDPQGALEYMAEAVA